MSPHTWLPALAVSCLFGLTGATGANADPRRATRYDVAIAHAPSEAPPPRPVVAAAADAGQYALDVDVEGPTGKTIHAGRPVKLRAVVKVTRTGAGAVTATSPFDDSPIAFRWRLANPPPGFDLAEWTDSDGRSIVFSAPETGEYHFTLSAAMWTGGPIPLLDDEGYTLVNAAGQAPTDPPKPPTVDPPVPPTTPAPVPPVDPPVTPPTPQPAEFAVAVRDAVIRLVPASCRAKGLQLGQRYASAATAAEKLNAVDMMAELKARKAANDITLGTDRAMWDGFFVWLAPELQRRIAVDPTTKTAKGLDVATAWAQISLGLLLAGGAT